MPQVKHDFVSSRSQKIRKYQKNVKTRWGHIVSKKWFFCNSCKKLRKSWYQSFLFIFNFSWIFYFFHIYLSIAVVKLVSTLMKICFYFCGIFFISPSIAFHPSASQMQTQTSMLPIQPLPDPHAVYTVWLPRQSTRSNIWTMIRTMINLFKKHTKHTHDLNWM